LTLEEEGRRREGEREMWKGKEEEAVRELSRVWDLRWFGTWRRRSQASSQASQAVSSLKERAVRQHFGLPWACPPKSLAVTLTYGTWLHPSGLLKQPRNCLSSEATTFDVILETQTQFDERP
jgi:hypothetical protein